MKRLHPSLLLGLLCVAPLLGQVRSTHAEVLPVKADIPEDETILKVITPLAAEIKASFGQPLVEAPEGVFRGRRGEENLLGYWVADAMRDAAAHVSGAPVPFAITNAGGLRANLRPGQIKVGDIFEMMPFENELVVIELTGAEVIQVVKEGIARRGGEPSSGVKAVVGGTPEAPTCTVTWADGRPIDPDGVVKVATSDYLYGGGDSIPTLKKGRHPFTTGVTLRQLLLDHCIALAKAHQSLLPPAPGRYLIPIPIQEAIRAKSFKF